MLEAHDADVFCVKQPSLDDPHALRWVDGIEAHRNSLKEPVPLRLDFSQIGSITPRALSALFELGARAPEGSFVLTGLSRPLTLLAVQVGLAEQFPVFVSADAADGRPRPSLRMRAFIYEVDGHVGAGAQDIADRPLLVRQLQFLRDCGVEDVCVEVCEGPHAAARAQFLLSHDPLMAHVQVIPSPHPLQAAELARRAGIPEDELFLALPSDLALHAKPDLQVAAPTRYLLGPPPGVDGEHMELHLRTRASDAQTAPVLDTAGWAMRVATLKDAHTLSCAALERQTAGLMLHAAELRPGVWLARGARVSPDATLTAPVWVGADARVFAGAKIGPRAVLGQGCIVERDATISEAHVAAHTIVGEGTRIRGAHAHAHGMTSFIDGVHLPVHDPLILSTRKRVGTAFSSRFCAWALLVLLALPWLLSLLARKALGRSESSVAGGGIACLLPALFEVMMGDRDLVGINDPRVFAAAQSEQAQTLRKGAFDLSSALAPNASTATRMRMWRWYQAHKSRALDRALWRERGLSTTEKAE